MTRGRALPWAGMRWVASGLLVVAGGTARADDTSANRAAARELGIQGVLLAEKGKCGEAIEKLERAEKLYHAPTTLERLGECKVDVGRIVDGTEDLQRVAKEDLPAGAPAAFTAAKTRAQGVLKKALPKIAHLRLHVSAPPDAKPTVLMDGNPYPDAALDGDRPVDPGTHSLAATADRMIKAETTLSLGEGESKSAELKLTPDPNAPTPVPIAPQNANSDNHGEGDQHGLREEDHPKPPPESPSHVPAYIALGIGAIGIGVGSVTGVLALSKKSSLDGACNPSKVCPSTSQSDLDSAKTMGTISTVGFIAGGVFVVAGIVLFLTEGSSSSASAQVGNVRVTPDLGAGYVGAHGSF